MPQLGQISPAFAVERSAQTSTLKSSPWCRAYIVEAIFVGTHHPAGNLLEILISGNDDALGSPNRADRALGKAGGLEFFVVQQLEASEKRDLS